MSEILEIIITMIRKPYTQEDFAWTQWGPEDIRAQAADVVARKKERYVAIKAIPENERTFKNTIVAIEMSNHGIIEEVYYIETLLKTSPSAEIRLSAQEAINEIQKEMIDIEYDREMYLAAKAVEAKGEKLEAEDKKLLSDMLRDYRRMGFELSEQDQKKLKKNLKRKSELEVAFSVNIDSYHDALELTRDELEGMSERYIDSLSETPEGKCIVSLDTPEYMPFMEQSSNHLLRKKLNDKQLRKGGEKNKEILLEVLALRYENAKILGYTDHSVYVLETKMAKNPEMVKAFLADLSAKIKPLREKEMAELTQWKQRATGDKNARIEYYDYYWAIEQLKKDRLQIDTEKVREYFPFETVKGGMFGIYEKLFSVVFTRIQGIPVWHEDVEIYRVDNTDGTLVAYFMLDLYPRANKYKHACMMPLITGYETMYRGDEYKTPLAIMIANFPKPAKNNPSLLSIQDVETFFHEFGHVMHGVMTTARYASQAGVSVANDFVEAPSQMLESWVLDKEMLTLISGHYSDASKKLPTELIEKLFETKRYMMGCWTARQLVFGLLDMELHTGKFDGDPNEAYKSYMQECLGITVPDDNLFTSGFGHLMGYDADYYGYMWSKVYSADMFTRFQKEGLLSVKTGMDYRKWILEKGSSQEEMDLLKGFLGREPNNEAFLKEIGL